MDVSAFQWGKSGNLWKFEHRICVPFSILKFLVFLAARQSISYMKIKHGNWNPTRRCQMDSNDDLPFGVIKNGWKICTVHSFNVLVLMGKSYGKSSL